jgi:hypothetical protein
MATGTFAQAAEILKDSSTEIAEFGVSYNRKLFPPRALRLGGAISEPCFIQKPKYPFK